MWTFANSATSGSNKVLDQFNCCLDVLCVTLGPLCGTRGVASTLSGMSECSLHCALLLGVKAVL